MNDWVVWFKGFWVSIERDRWRIFIVSTRFIQHVLTSFSRIHYYLSLSPLVCQVNGFWAHFHNAMVSSKDWEMSIFHNTRRRYSRPCPLMNMLAAILAQVQVCLGKAIGFIDWNNPSISIAIATARLSQAAYPKWMLSILFSHFNNKNALARGRSNIHYLLFIKR